MMDMNTIIQRNNLVIQSMNGSDITTTQALIVLGVGLALGVVLMVVVNWLLNR